MSSKFHIPLIFGTGDIGSPGRARRPEELDTAQKLIDAFGTDGPGAIDTSQIYGLGSSEEILSSINLRGSKVDTKIYPVEPGDHSPAKIKELFKQTLERLNGIKIRVFYLHAPDRSVPYQETMSAINDLYLAGHFEYFGLSNFPSYEVAEIVTICKEKGYVLPTVYQGIYNALDRTVESELIPCLRRYGIKFAAYSPMAGGFLVGRYLDQAAEAGSRFDPKIPFGPFYNDRYMGMIAPVKELRTVAMKHQLSLHEASIRWLQHHSILRPSDLGIIFGASKPSRIEVLIKYNGEGPLPDEVVQAFEECYKKVKGGLPNYRHDPPWYSPEKFGH